MIILSLISSLFSFLVLLLELLTLSTSVLKQKDFDNLRVKKSSIRWNKYKEVRKSMIQFYDQRLRPDLLKEMK